MKRAIFSCLTVVLVISLVGCVSRHGRRPWACMGGSCAQAPETCMSCDAGCASCENGAACGYESAADGDVYGDPCVGDPDDACEDGGRACRLGNHMRRRAAGRGEEAGPPGPPVGTVTYPYYTTRGPRDFLAKNPPSIGP